MAKTEFYQSRQPVQRTNSFGMKVIVPFNDRKLIIEDLKTCRKATVYHQTGLHKWEVESTTKFYYKDCDADDYRIREYYGFLGENVTKIEQ